jgi:hypothetical protein
MIGLSRSAWGKPALRRLRELILNYFRAQKLISSGVVEGLNNKAKVTLRKSYGFRTYRILELALYHSLGKLPVVPKRARQRDNSKPGAPNSIQTSLTWPPASTRQSATVIPR